MKRILFVITAAVFLLNYSYVVQAQTAKKTDKNKTAIKKISIKKNYQKKIATKKTYKKKGRSAYDDPYKNGEFNINSGIGFGLAGIYGDISVPPISVSAEYNLRGFKHLPKSVNELPISVGAVLSYASSVIKTSYDNGFTVEKLQADFSYYVFGARVSYHYGELVEIPKLDLYVGGLIGYSYVSYENSGSDFYEIKVRGSYPLYGGYAGLRYYFTDTIGAFAEGGYGVSYISGGVTFKL